MRHRTRSTVEPAVVTKAVGNSVVGNCTTPFGWVPNPSLDINSSFVPYSKTESFDDVVTLHFEERRDHGEIINNPMTKSVTQVTKTVVLYEEMYSLWRYITCGTPPVQITAYNTGSHIVGTHSPDVLLASEVYPGTPTLSTSAVSDVAVTAAWANAQNADLLAFATLAESQKTIHGLSSLVKRIIRFALLVRKGSFVKIWKTFTASNLADSWMEGRYMIRPLVYDMWGLYKAVNNVLRRDSYRQTYRGSHSASASATEVKKTFTRPGGYEVWGKYTTTRTITARAGVLAHVQPIVGVTSFGLDQPFATIWELVPFSFVVDWFLNVGQVIASWEPSLGLTGLASWVTVTDAVGKTKAIDHTVDLYVPTFYTYQRWVNITGGACSTTTSVTTRVPSPCRPLLPHPKLRLDAAKLLDLVIMARRIIG